MPERKMPTRQQIRNLNPERLKEFRRRGMTLKQIAKLCGVNQSTIFNRLKELELKTYG